MGSAVVALVLVALANMFDTGRVVPAPVSGELNRYTFTCGPPDLSGNVTLGWTMLYEVKVAAIILTTAGGLNSLRARMLLLRP